MLQISVAHIVTNIADRAQAKNNFFLEIKILVETHFTIRFVLLVCAIA